MYKIELNLEANFTCASNSKQVSEENEMASNSSPTKAINSRKYQPSFARALSVCGEHGLDGHCKKPHNLDSLLNYDEEENNGFV